MSTVEFLFVDRLTRWQQMYKEK